RWFMPSDHAFGDALPLAIRLMEWGVDFHDNLLAGSAGRTVNGVAAILVTVLLITGAVLWWPGKTRWPRSLIVPRPAKTRRFSWHLHSALGLWGFVLLFGWAVTGIYFAFPGPFEAAFNFLAADAEIYPRPGEEILLTLIRWHFGRFGGLTIRVLWVILGLIPAALFITGFIVWWRRARPSSGPRALRGN
ncbi:MAG: PepSY domain-containing protein, partial [Gammaproteobacteria bacterium]|nr:PepSY domain-containing protein [Gammaproteobacteria bacterium]